jgi:hypothetical protein
MCQAYDGEAAYIRRCEEIAWQQGYDDAKSGKEYINPHEHFYYEKKAYESGFRWGKNQPTEPRSKL